MNWLPILKESEPDISMKTYEASAWNLETAFGSESSFHVSTYHRAASGQGGERRWINRAFSSGIFCLLAKTPIYSVC